MMEDTALDLKSLETFSHDHRQDWKGRISLSYYHSANSILGFVYLYSFSCIYIVLKEQSVFFPKHKVHLGP